VKVLVTGGSGFIGSHVVDRLLARGHQPLIFDLVEPHRNGGSPVECVTGDILDGSSLRRAMRSCDGVIHLAAVADVDQVALEPLRADLVNTRGTAVVLEAARDEDIRHVIYGSTIWVYGNASGAPALDEDVLLAAPEHFYTATKLAGEMYCRSYGQMFGLAPTILRFGIPHGPRARAATVVAKFVARALAGEAISINGDGHQARQFVYVEDLAGGIVAALTEGARGRTYNLVGDETTSVREIAGIVRALIGDVKIVHVSGRLGDLGQVHISSERARAELGWSATTSFADGVAHYVEWVAGTNGSSHARTAATIAGSAAAVLRQESRAL
jgi:UDP-glucose 4-epimerase